MHSLRHTFVYQAAMHGIPLPIVQRIVGHMSDRMTRVYTSHAGRDELAAHLSTLPDAMAAPAPVKTEDEEDAPDLEALLAKLEAVKAAIRRLVNG